jgi:hypothetical protein
MENETPPEFRKSVFSCPHCHIAAKHSWDQAYRQNSEPMYTFSGAYYKTNHILFLFVSKCSNCGCETIWYNQEVIYPINPLAPLPNEDMPDNVKADYLEAREIAQKSPRAAVALLRLALEKLLPYIGGEGKGINADIAKLAKDGLDQYTIKSLDTLRIVGNEAVHPGLIDLKDNQEMAMFAFSLLNLIVENRISHRNRIDLVYNQLPSNKLLGIFNRDKK